MAGSPGTNPPGLAYPVLVLAALPERRFKNMVLLLWIVLLLVCWPLALLAAVLYPLLWLLLLPFRLVGVAVGGVLDLVAALLFLPGRVLRRI
jgi:hypothetical protein